MSTEPVTSIYQFFFNNSYDVVDPASEEGVTTPQTGKERLRQMLSADKYGQPSREILFIGQTSVMSFVAGGIIGGIIESRSTFTNFIENNEATKFANHLEAKRKLTREMGMAMFRGAFRFGWRVGLFSTTLTGLMTTMAVYRGEQTVLDYTVAGAATGGLFRINLGLKGMFAGSVAGAFLGMIGGVLSTALLKVSGVSLTDMTNFSKEIHMARQEALHGTFKDILLKEQTELMARGGDTKQYQEIEVDVEPDKTA